MPVYIRKGPLEIPLGSEINWASEEHEDYFLRDPEQARDCLPQPYRMIAKVVELLIDQAFEIIKTWERTREEEKLKKKTDILQPTAEIQVSRRVNCVAAGANGSYLFVGLSEGLRVYSLADHDWICGWEADGLEVCSLSLCHLKSRTYLVGTVDDMGIARLFYFSEEKLHFVKAINETEDLSKRTVCTKFQLSHGGDYAGFLLEGSGECWLEVYKLPKDSWLKELEHSQTTVPSTPLPGTEPPTMSIMSEQKITPPVLLIKIKPPKPLAGSTYKTVQEAVQKNEDSNVFGGGQNHLISSQQWEQQEAIFTGVYQKYLGLNSPEIPDGEASRFTMFHFVSPTKILHSNTETMPPGMPNSVSVHWKGCHNFFIYLLGKSFKDKTDADSKPDIVWPCAAAIKFSAVSICTSYIALALENETLVVWDTKYSGFPLAVVALPEERCISSIYFVEDVASIRDVPAVPRAQILVWCTDKSLYLITAAGGRESSMVLFQESSACTDDQISAITPIPSLPNSVLLYYRRGIVELLDVARRQAVCQFGFPPTHNLPFPWQPVYAVDTENLCLFLKANEKGAESDACSVFAFSLNTFRTQRCDTVPPQNLEQKCALLLHARLQSFPERKKQIAECWSLLRKQASDFMGGDSLAR
ncbi:WD repeat-containing protein 93 [Gastrophryne carolinensis]